MSHYVYRVEHLPTRRFYIGVRSCGDAPTKDAAYMGSGTVLLKVLASHPKSEFRKTILARLKTRRVLEPVRRVRGVDPVVSRQDIVAAARGFLGTPFHHQARKKGVGIDCAGLIAMVASECGIPLIDHAELNYSRYPTIARHLQSECIAQMRPVPDGKVGSIILFWVHRPALPQHLAIRTGDDTMIHAWYDAGKVIETHLGPYWSLRIHSVFDLPGVD